MRHLFPTISIIGCLACSCANIREIPDNPQLQSNSWGYLETKGGDIVMDSLESVRSVQTSEIALLLSMITKQDSLYVLTLSKAELDSLGVSEECIERVNNYLEMLNPKGTD